MMHIDIEDSVPVCFNSKPIPADWVSFSEVVFEMLTFPEGISAFASIKGNHNC